MDVGMEEVSIAGMQQWPDVSQTSYTQTVSTKVFIEQEVLALTRVVDGQREHARMDLVFNLNSSVTLERRRTRRVGFAARLFGRRLRVACRATSWARNVLRSDLVGSSATASGCGSAGFRRAGVGAVLLLELER